MIRINKAIAMNIGDKIKYLDEYGESCVGTIQSVLSDMDSYDEMRLKDGISYYASKKLTAGENLRRKKAKKSPLSSPIFAPVKPKNMASVFLEIVPSSKPKGVPDYIPIASVIRNNTILWNTPQWKANN